MTGGMTLRLERVAAGVNVKALARRMGVSRTSVHKYEGQADVEPTVAAAYRKALASIVAEREETAA